MKTKMKTTMMMLSMLTATTAACSTMPRQAVEHVAKADADLRGAAPVRPHHGRSLVSGPALVHHLETEGAGVVTLYLTDDPGIGDRGCPSAAAEGAPSVAVRRGASRIADLQVPDGKRICAAVEGERSMRVSWHASPAGTLPGNGYDVALLAR